MGEKIVSATLMGASMYVPVDRPEKLLLVALADHASDDGTGVYVTNERLQLKTSSAERTVRYTMRKLEETLLVARVGHLGGGRHLAVDYELNSEMIYNLARANGWTQKTRKKTRQPTAPFLSEKGATTRTKPGNNTSERVQSTAPQPKEPLEPHAGAREVDNDPPTLVETHPRHNGEDLGAWLARLNTVYQEETTR